MSRKSRMQNLQAAKDRRMKMIAAGGLVVLVAVLAFEVPKVLKSSGSSSPPPAATTSATGTPAPPATTAPGTAAAAVMPTAGTKLPNSDLGPRPSKSQLYSFSHFAGKDPFIQQVTAAKSSAGLGPASGPATGGKSKPSPPNGGSGGGGNVGRIASTQQGSARTLAQTGAAVIQVNGHAQTVRIGASFPSSNPLFKLVSVAAGVARIGIANGSYTSGEQTVTLTSGHSLTLVDTADGARYTLRLLSAS